MKNLFFLLLAAIAVCACSTDQDSVNEKQSSNNLSFRETEIEANVLVLNIAEKDLDKTDLSNYSQANSSAPPRIIMLTKDCSYFSAHFGYAYGYGHDRQGNQYFWWTSRGTTYCQRVQNSGCI